MAAKSATQQRVEALKQKVEEVCMELAGLGEESLFMSINLRQRSCFYLGSEPGKEFLGKRMDIIENFYHFINTTYPVTEGELTLTQKDDVMETAEGETVVESGDATVPQDRVELEYGADAVDDGSLSATDDDPDYIPETAKSLSIAPKRRGRPTLSDEGSRPNTIQEMERAIMGDAYVEDQSDNSMEAGANVTRIEKIVTNDYEYVKSLKHKHKAIYVCADCNAVCSWKRSMMTHLQGCKAKGNANKEGGKGTEIGFSAISRESISTLQTPGTVDESSQQHEVILSIVEEDDASGTQKTVTKQVIIPKFSSLTDDSLAQAVASIVDAQGEHGQSVEELMKPDGAQSGAATTLVSLSETDKVRDQDFQQAVELIESLQKDDTHQIEELKDTSSTVEPPGKDDAETGTPNQQQSKDSHSNVQEKSAEETPMEKEIGDAPAEADKEKSAKSVKGKGKASSAQSKPDDDKGDKEDSQEPLVMSVEDKTGEPEVLSAVTLHSTKSPTKGSKSNTPVASPITSRSRRQVKVNRKYADYETTPIRIKKEIKEEPESSDEMETESPSVSARGKSRTQSPAASEQPFAKKETRGRKKKTVDKDESEEGKEDDSTKGATGGAGKRKSRGAERDDGNERPDAKRRRGKESEDSSEETRTRSKKSRGGSVDEKKEKTTSRGTRTRRMSTRSQREEKAEDGKEVDIDEEVSENRDDADEEEEEEEDDEEADGREKKVKVLIETSGQTTQTIEIIETKEMGTSTPNPLLFKRRRGRPRKSETEDFIFFAPDPKVEADKDALEEDWYPDARDEDDDDYKAVKVRTEPPVRKSNRGRKKKNPGPLDPNRYRITADDLQEAFRKGEEKGEFTCRECGETLMWKRSYMRHLEAHVQVNQGKRKKFNCKVCNKCFVSEWEMKNHLRGKHKLLNVFECDTCPRKFHTAVQFKNHKINCTSENPNTDPIENDPEQPFTCNYCLMKFKTEQQLETHKELHSIVEYRCEECGKVFPEAYRLKNHVRDTHDKSDVFACEVCGKQFTSARYLHRHRVCVHQKTESICRTCGKLFPDKSGLRLHIKIEHEEPDATTCPICKEKFPTEKALDAHRPDHYNFQCETCGKKFQKLVKLRDHVRSHTNDYSFWCKECNKGFTLESSLQNHMLNIHSNKIYMCSTCGCTFKNAQTLKNHMKVHTDSAEFSCKFCDSTYRTHEGLKNHMIENHMTEEQIRACNMQVFKCEYCDKVMGRKQHYERHRDQHLGVKKYKCPECALGFFSQYHLNRHMKSHLSYPPSQKRIRRPNFKATSTTTRADEEVTEELPEGTEIIIDNTMIQQDPDAEGVTETVYVTAIPEGHDEEGQPVQYAISQGNDQQMLEFVVINYPQENVPEGTEVTEVGMASTEEENDVVQSILNLHDGIITDASSVVVTQPSEGPQ